MKLIEYANAYAALKVLSGLEFSYSSAYAIADLKRRISHKAEFFMSEELKLAAMYGVTLPDGRLRINDGRFEFKGDSVEERSENCRVYNAKRDELCAVEDEDMTEPVHITVSSDFKLTPLLLEALEGFVVFEVEDAGKL